jgi:hypothetical protein
MADKIKAYEVQDRYGDAGSTIVFDVRAVSARRDGANELSLEFGDVSCRRARWADDLAPGPVSPKVAIKVGGWQYECTAQCGHWVDGETEKPFYEENGNPWCSQGCYDSTMARLAKREAERAAAEAACRAATMAKFPFAEITYIAEMPSMRTPWRAYFRFPGGKHDASWCPSAPAFADVAIDDIEAWQALVPEPQAGAR